MKPIAVFQLELEEAPLLNRFMNMHWAARHSLKKRISKKLLVQIGFRKGGPLPGRPKLWVLRRSTKRPDQDSAGTKLWLDELVKLGWLKDDSPDHVEVVSQWEKAKRGDGGVIVHIFSGEQANESFEKEHGWV